MTNEERNKILEANRKVFAENPSLWHLHPYSGKCSCGHDFIEAAGKNYIGAVYSGCPKCLKSYSN